MPLECKCTVELNKDLTFVEVKDNPNSLTEAWIIYEGKYEKKPECAKPCDTTVPRCDWAISDVTKDPDSAPEPYPDVLQPLKCRVTVSRDATYKFKLTLRVTVECKKKSGESGRVDVYEFNGPPCTSEASITVETQPHR